jgi:hypothetical protein
LIRIKGSNRAAAYPAIFQKKEIAMRRFALLAALCFAVVPTLAWSQGRMPHAGQMPPGGANMPMMGQGMMGYDNMGPGMMDGGPAMMMRMMGMMGMMGMPGMMGMIDGDSHIDGRIAFLKAELKLDAAQARLFEPVEKVLRDAAAKHATRPMPMPGMNDTLPARLDTMEKILAEHIEALRAVKGAVTPLYTALQPEQREIVDRFLLRSMM